MPHARKIVSLSDAVDYFDDVLNARPERDRCAADQAAVDGVRRPYPAFSLHLQARTDDPDGRDLEFELPELRVAETPEGELARDIVRSLSPLQLLNPVRRCIGSGDRGPGTLVASFGIPLRADVGYTPAKTRPLAEVLADAPPDPARSGLLPQIRERIERVRTLAPSSFKISMPDTQGPFNLAHAIVGEEALISPYTAPDAFHRLMDRITTFWIAVRRNLVDWIGPDRLYPTDRFTRICECSVNLISRKMYEEFVLPYDLRIARALGPLDIHTCSGPHVFHATLDLLPGVAMTEAGFIANTAAGSTPVDLALAAIGTRPIVLRIGQELPRGQELEFVKRDLDRCRSNPRLTFDYTGMHWYNRDCRRIRELHRQLDDYWAESCV
jgi:hypothetical protein